MLKKREQERTNSQLARLDGRGTFVWNVKRHSRRWYMSYLSADKINRLRKYYPRTVRIRGEGFSEVTHEFLAAFYT
jgi:hypothetical protein